MAYGVGERPERSPAALLSTVEYPISRDDLVAAAGEAEAPVEVIKFLQSLPNRVYTSPSDVQRQFGEAGARFGLNSDAVRHRGDLAKEAVETGANPTRHP